MKKLAILMVCFIFISFGTALADGGGVIDWGLEGVYDTMGVVDVVQLTTNPYDDGVQCWGSNPWSPDGQYIVYQAEIDGTSNEDNEICTMKADGSEYWQLTDNETCDSHPNFTPDGLQIVFQRKNPETELADIWIMDTDGDNQVNLRLAHADNEDLAEACENKPQVSPDGTQIAFHTCDEDIWVMNSDGSGPVKLTGDMEECSHHSWSPDGQWIMFQSDALDDGNCRIYKVRADGSAAPVMLSPADEEVDSEDWCESWPFWSPDGQWIAYHGRYVDPDTGDETHTLSIMAPAGANREILVSEIDEYESDVDWDEVCGPKSWSADSNFIIFKKYGRFDGTSITSLFSYNLITDEVRRLTTDYYDYRCWLSPDGRRILFRDYGSNRDQNYEPDPVGSPGVYDNLDQDLLVVNLVPWYFDEIDAAYRDEIADDIIIENDDIGVSAEVDITDPAEDPTEYFVAEYEGNPTGVAFNGHFFDLFVPDASNVAEIVLKLYWPVDVTPETYDLYWFDGDSWSLVSDYTVVNDSPPYTMGEEQWGGYLEITIDDTTSPGLDDLDGTVFAVGEPVTSDDSSSSHHSSSSGTCFISTASF